jgi:hypothetical protein
MRWNTLTRRRLCGVLVTLVPTGALAALASGTGAVGAPGAVPSLLHQIIERPTGRNGYEEFLMAAELVNANEQLATAVASGATLAQKRTAVTAPASTRALALLRQGLRKPIEQPRSTFGIGMSFPEAGLFQQLGRLLTIEEYVLFADGRTQAAVESLHDSLLFARAIESSFPDGWAGRRMTQTAVGAFAPHLDQLSVANCERVIQICREWLQAPSPVGEVLQAESQMNKEALARVRAQPQLLIEWWPSEVVGAGEPEREIAALAGQDPARFNAILEGAVRLVDTHFKEVEEQLKRPAWLRTIPTLSKDRSPEERLAGCLIYADNTARLVDDFTREQAMVQLLGCEAAIRRYRWEYDRLPASLAVLNLGALALDPFSGQPLRYTANGRRYELSSAGPVRRGRAEAGNGRVPINLGQPTGLAN